MIALEKTESPNLNQREKDVLKHVSEGQSYKEVAYTMSLAEPTIKIYMKRAKKKLGAANTGQAIALFIRSCDA